MSEIKLFVTHTPNRNTVRIEHPLMYNVIAGIFHLRTNLIVN